MLKISILKVQNPSCLWGRVVWGSGSDPQTKEQYDSLQARINLFYSDVTQDLSRMKPTPLEEGQVCVVFCSLMKSWCRAVVESVIVDSVSCQARCLLVDHGERLVVPSDRIRVAAQNFLQLPFWVRRFHLTGIKPATLRVSVCEERAELVPSSRWDSSATLYLHSLLRASTLTEAVLLESTSNSTSLELYVTVHNVKICVNDDLVAKKFAFYIRESADGGEPDEVDPFPVMLSSRILTQTVCSTTNRPRTHTHTAPVMSQSPAAAGAADWPTAPSSPQSQPQEGCRSKVTDGPPSPGSGSKQGSDAAAAAESDSSEDTDSSLAAALNTNLSLFRFLKFLNPSSSSQQAAPSHEEEPESRPEETAASDTCTGPDHSLVESAERRWRAEEDRACSRLLEWLNPEPLNVAAESADDEVVPSDPRRSGFLLHSAVPVEPCSRLDDAPLTDTLRRVLRRKQYGVLSAADRHGWPAVARGLNTVIVSHDAERPIGYLAPLLTHILLNSAYASLSCSAGPVAVLLCPGWEKVQAVCDLLEDMKVASVLHPLAVLLGVGKDEAKSVQIPKSCLLLVTTPFSLVRLLSCRCFLFLRLNHLVLDEADRLFSLAPDQMAVVLQHFQKVASSEKMTSRPQQLVAVAKRWTAHMEALLANHMPFPCVVMAIPEEAALYGNVQQIILMTSESSKVSVLLGALDFNPHVGQKTLIVTDSAQEVEDVFKAVSNKSAFCLKTHEGLTHQFDFVVQQWRKDIGPGTHVILVTTNTCLKCLGVRDATCVVHFSFPTSPRVFGGRLFCMSENFRNLSERDLAGGRAPGRSVLLISERNARHVTGVLRYLGRTNAPLPAELLSFARGVHEAREDQKTCRPLCRDLKSCGVCRDSSVCPDRHTFIPQLDRSELPASGLIEVVPLHVMTASVFCGRIVRKEDGGFQSMASEMSRYYGDRKPGAGEVLQGELYAVQEDDAFHRVKILSVPERGDRPVFGVLVGFIDVGKEEEVKSHQLLQLPQRFHALPAQAVEIVVCRVRPADAEADWHPKVTRAISQKIRGLQHRARAVLSVGNTVFVDPMVPGMKTVINEYDVQSEILKSGMAVSNPEHLDLLRALCREAGRRSGSAGGPLSLEVRIKAEEEVLSEAFKAAEVSRLADLPPLEPCEPPSPEPSLVQTVVPEPSAVQSLVPPPEPSVIQTLVPELSVVQTLVPAPPEPSVVQSLVPEPSVVQTLVPEPSVVQSLVPPPEPSVIQTLVPEPSVVQTLVPAPPEPSVVQTLVPAPPEPSVVQSLVPPPEPSVVQTLVPAPAAKLHPVPVRDLSADPESAEQTTSFHPQVRWYQTSDSLTVTVKLLNPERQSCNFHCDRVEYSGSVNGRSYRADLQLHADIAADRCFWEMKSNEPVLRLVKRQQGRWERLLRNKNIFVKFDMEHFEDDEDRIPNGVCFVENMEKDARYVNSESGSESD